MIFSYLPIAFVLGCIFVIFNALLIPLAYISQNYYLLKSFFSSNEGVFQTKIYKIVFFIIMGMPIILLSYFRDIPIFFRHLFDKNEDK